jgi:hypothetical protein
MSLREHEQSRARHTRRKQKKRPSALDAPLAMAHPNQVLTFHEWCRLNRFSERTGRRVLASGTGPTVVQLSPKRVGITIASNDAWQQSKARG